MTKPTAYFIETARGASVDEEALADDIEHAVIVGAGLNTFAGERLPISSRLRRLDPERVILMPCNLPTRGRGRRPTRAWSGTTS